jgi:hypothetical protein
MFVMSHEARIGHRSSEPRLYVGATRRKDFLRPKFRKNSATFPRSKEKEAKTI